MHITDTLHTTWYEIFNTNKPSHTNRLTEPMQYNDNYFSCSSLRVFNQWAIMDKVLLLWFAQLKLDFTLFVDMLATITKVLQTSQDEASIYIYDWYTPKSILLPAQWRGPGRDEYEGLRASWGIQQHLKSSVLGWIPFGEICPEKSKDCNNLSKNRESRWAEIPNTCFLLMEHQGRQL